MKRRVGLGLTLAVCAAAEAADPGVTMAPAAPSDAAVPIPAPTTTAPTIAPTTVPAATATPATITKPALDKPLDLRVGDVRTYMMPSEYRAALGAADADRNTVVVEAKRELLPVEHEKPIPTWPLGPLWWSLKNPTQSWRIFLPDINRPEDGPPDPVPPPIFRWGP